MGEIGFAAYVRSLRMRSFRLSAQPKGILPQNLPFVKSFLKISYFFLWLQQNFISISHFLYFAQTLSRVFVHRKQKQYIFLKEHIKKTLFS